MRLKFNREYTKAESLYRIIFCKAQKEYYAKQRGTWGGLNPVTRSVPSGKTYNRNKCHLVILPMKLGVMCIRVGHYSNIQPPI